MGLRIGLRLLFMAAGLYGANACGASAHETARPAAPKITFTGVPAGRMSLGEPAVGAVPVVSRSEAESSAESEFSQGVAPGVHVETHLGTMATGELVWGIACQCAYSSGGDCGLTTGTPCPSPAPDGYFFVVLDATTGQMVTAGGG